MGLFEFLMILVSVIIGLALSEILMGSASLLRERDTVHFHWIHVLFQVGVFFALIQQWWESWNFASVSSISFGNVLLMLCTPVALFMLAHLLFPRPAANSNLEEYYYRQAPILWGLVLIGTFLGTFVAPYLRGDHVFEAANWSGIPVVGICVALISVRKRWLHSLLAPLMVLLVVLDTWLVNPSISAS